MRRRRHVRARLVTNVTASPLAELGPVTAAAAGDTIAIARVSGLDRTTATGN